MSRDTAKAARMVAHLLGDGCDWRWATTWEHAERRLHETPPDAVIA